MLTLNGQQFVSAGVNVTYYAAPALSIISPSTGPEFGDTRITATGVNFRNGDNYTCRFENATVTAERLTDTAIECHSAPRAVVWTTDNPNFDPRTNAAESSFAISLNNQDYTVNDVSFYYNEGVVVRSIGPDAGPTVGGTVVLVRGAHFAGGDAYRCKFGSQAVLAVLHGARANGYYLECTAPPVNGTGADVFVPLEVSLNGQQYTRDDVLYRYFAHQSIVGLLPTSGPVHGGTAVMVTVRSEGSASDIAFFCRHIWALPPRRSRAPALLIA